LREAIEKALRGNTELLRESINERGKTETIQRRGISIKTHAFYSNEQSRRAELKV